MADAPIGISFIPSAANAASGPANLSTDGGTGRGSTDLAQAFKVLSLRLPSAPAASAPVDPTLLNSAGATGLPNLPSGLSPYAALFQALLKSSLGASQTTSASGGAPALPNWMDQPSNGPDLSALFGGGATDASAPARVGAPSSTASPTLSGLFGGGGDGTGAAGTTSPGRLVPKIQFGTDGQPATSSAPAQPAFDTTVPDRPSQDFGNYY